MKNISVGKKLLLGFGVLILIFAMILTYATVTSIKRNKALKQIKQMSDIQRTANLMLDNFNLARIEIRSVFTSIDAENEADIALGYLEKCNEYLDLMETMSADLNGYMAEDIATLRRMFLDVEAGLKNVSSNSSVVQDAIVNMRENGAVITSFSEELFEIVTRLDYDMDGSYPLDVIKQMEGAIIYVSEIEGAVERLLITNRELMLNQDLSVIAELYAGLDDILQRGNYISSIPLSSTAQAVTDRMIEAAEEFRAKIAETEAVMLDSEKSIAETRAVFGKLNTLVNDYVNTITGHVDLMLENTTSASQTAMIIMIIVGNIAAVLSLPVALGLAYIITKPLNMMKEIAVQVGTTGNLSFPAEFKEKMREQSKGKDELSQSLLAFNSFVDHVTRMAEFLDQVARKDLTLEIELLSEDDTMGNSLKDMIANLNSMFGEINYISTQVAASAHEIAMGAQSIARGSTEQSATVQQISASMNEIEEQMNISNETVMQAAQQSTQMSQNAEIGNDKMNQMGSAINEINEASHNIQEVIKVIDDIAFQTNILALNAAVEAAHAGAHGKGFAVVADEVRNLAGKSAAAVQKTAALISANIEKTETGLSSTMETAESLTGIISGIAKTNEFLQTVAQQSENTKVTTAQVASAVDQVSQVVQQNSTTSEENAAASEELSTQAQTLQQLIAEFKLKSDSLQGIQQRYLSSQWVPQKDLSRQEVSQEVFQGFPQEYTESLIISHTPLLPSSFSRSE